jgi:membrane protein DedA with SNARE-associated domain
VDAAWVTELAESPAVYPLLWLLTVADAFLVVVPSETAVVALAATSASLGAPKLGLLVPVAATGAFCGDLACYFLGRLVGLDRWRWQRSGRAAAAITRMRAEVDRRAAMLILTARYIPFARIAVNLVAGASRLPLRRYVPLAAAAGLAWGLYNTVIGAATGAALADAPLLAVLVSVVIAMVLGFAVDAMVRRRAQRG